MFRYVLVSLLFISLVAHAGVEGIGEPRVTWTKRKVHVCWRDGVKVDPTYIFNDFTVDQKEVVRKVVEREFTEAKTGISFFGWESCSDIADQKYDLEIFQDSEIAATNPMVEERRKVNAEGWAILGEGSAGQSYTVSDHTGAVISQTTGYLNRNVVKSSMYLMVRTPLFRFGKDSHQQLDQLEFTALHEFGHVAGLRHEHIREESKNDPNCNYRQDTASEELMQTAAMNGEYDPNSVMNYCWGAVLVQKGSKFSKKEELPNITNETLYSEITNPKTKKKHYQIRIGLSATDISTLRKMYPKKAAPAVVPSS